MVPLEFSDNLLAPLIIRSQARTLCPLLGFCDDAAEYLVDRLNLDVSTFISDHEVSVRQHRNLIRCKWLDESVLNFFQQHPQALGINLGAGLNTRFQRLSRQLAWPQFRWADIDTAETIAFNAGLLPNIENYRLLDADYWQDDWLTKAGWKSGMPVIFILEDNALTVPKRQLQRLLNYIQRKTASNAHTHLVFDYGSQSLLGHHSARDPNRGWFSGGAARALEQFGLDGFVVRDQDLTAHCNGTFRWIGKWHRKLFKQNLWGGAHIALAGGVADSDTSGTFFRSLLG